MSKHLVCMNCGFTAREDSDEWGSYEERHTLDGHYIGSEYFMQCPDCGSEEIDDAVECEECHEYFQPGTLICVRVTHPADDEYEEETEELLDVCPYCYEEKYFVAPLGLNEHKEES